MRVAFATEDMQRVDAHFGWARNLAIYEVSPAGHRFAEVVQFDGNLNEDGVEDKLTPKIDALRDCAIVYVAAIGGSAAAKVVNAKVHPVKVPNPEAINDILDRLVTVLKGTPPPWLRKALMKGQDRKFDFEDGADDE
jgi:nitrogen fixation protein NifX